jgi:hypothetical protein
VVLHILAVLQWLMVCETEVQVEVSSPRSHLTYLSKGKRCMCMGM